MKILLHGFGSYAIVYRHLIEAARRLAPEVEWAIILPTPHHRDVLHGVLADDDILSLQDVQSRHLVPVADTSHLAGYRGHFFADIEAEKRHLKHRAAWQQLARADEIYRIYKTFVQRTRATHVFISQIEAFEGKALLNIARELGLGVVVPTYVRIFGGTVFSSDELETLPPHRRATPQLIDEARTLIARYRSEFMPAARPVEDAGEAPLDSFRKPFVERFASFVRRSLARPDLFEIDTLRTGFLNNLPWLRDAWWQLRILASARECDVRRLEGLPKRFVYYPLQTTPESSINTPAPYFVDQLRAIDAIRYAMPNDHMLVVKEHPTGGIPIRPTSFIRSVRRRAGVVVVHYKTDGRALIQRAACTISVTGTATLEAFLLGKPSLALGSNINSAYLGGPCPIDRLDERMRHAIANPPSDSAIADAVAEMLSVRYDFRLSTPGLPGEPVLRRQNIERLLAGLLDHIRRSARPN